MKRPLLSALASILFMTTAPAAIAADPADPFIWLESVDSPQAMGWVRAENERTLGVLEKDPRFAANYRDALAIAEAKDRIPLPTVVDGQVYNLWQDADHVQGIWRRTTLAEYRSATPSWTTVLDLDAMSKADGKSWVWHGFTCQEPNQKRCLVDLSNGGEDASTLREFDLDKARFVDGGFTLPTGKQSAIWQDDDTLLVAREWEPGQLTASGYAFVVKRLKRGQPLASAQEIFRGEKSDVAVSPIALHDGSGHTALILSRGVTFFESESHLVTPQGVVKLALPPKHTIQALVAGRLVVSLEQDWTAGGRTYPTGSLVSIDLASAQREPADLHAALIYAPGPRESFQSAAATRDKLVVTTTENVRGRAFLYTPEANGAWSHKQLPLPDNLAIGIIDADFHGDDAFLSVTGFLTPSSLAQVDARTGRLETVKTLPAKFDASQDVVEQLEATSSDGTKIPYFVVHRKDLKLDGHNPTIINAYGGFQVSQTPVYSSYVGKLWLEKGGVFVLANIRGGGEFGPAWHEAGLKTKRQIIYDDFAAVSRDLIARKITSPRRLGIEGGSNGGLLMGVMMTQHPELYNAVEIAIPLLDMLRFEQIAAGASWVGEYGSVANPQERAFLAGISPYHNLKTGVRYPEPFVWTTTKDDRVGPQHARKFAARLKEMHQPYLYYEVTEGGHGAGANLKEKARTTALEMTYFARKLMD